jgi:hypothetical protein
MRKRSQIEKRSAIQGERERGTERRKTDKREGEKETGSI